MPEKEKTFLNFSRRNFLKTAAVVAGSAWLGSSLGCTPQSTSSSGGSGGEAPTAMQDEIFNVACRPNCFESCQINAHVRDGKLVKTSMAPLPDPAYNRVCLRGLSSVSNIYDPDRIKYPMKRAGERGEDKWERISWDDAINEIADKFTAYQKEFGPQSIVKSIVSGNYGQINQGFTATFFNNINASTMAASLDIGNAVGLNRVVGWAGIWLGNENADLVNAKNIFIWGNNLTDAQIQEWHFMADAIEAGAKTIVIDPIFTQMAAKADMFVPIRPASDAALILAMMNIIITKDQIDRKFLLERTVAPFLVRLDTGEFLRMSDLGVEPTEGPKDATGKATKVDPVVVWSGSESKGVALEGASDPTLEGEFTVEGFACKTAYTLLKEEVMQYPAEVASQLTEIPVETINELAQLATEGPVTHRCGWGSQAYDNGVHPHHAGAALAAITGQMGFPGAMYGSQDWNVYSGFNATHNAAKEAPAVKSPSISCLVMADVIKTGKFKGEDITIKALWVHDGNPLCTFVDTNGWLNDVFPNIEFIVTVDMMMTDTARYSDIVLPCAQFFEYEDVVASGPCYHMIHSEKAVDPPFEAKPDHEIMRLLAAKMGLDIYPETNQQWLKDHVDTEASAALGITYDKLVQEKAIRWTPKPLVRWTDTFLTPSGRMEFYVEKPTPQQDYGQTIDVARERLPRFFPPGEAWPEDPMYQKYPFVLMSERPRFRVHGQWYNNKILRELDPVPTVKINPADASKKGIKSGDLVECFNDRGFAVATASLNDAIRPGTLVYPKSWQINQHVAGGWSQLSTFRHDPVMVNQSFMDVLCDFRPWTGGGN